MGDFRSYREASRSNWGTERRAGLDIEQINCGALLRIADATEAMAKSYNDLIRDRDYWKQRAQRAESSLDVSRRSNRALRGHIKRLKR